jgi:putative hemolysin
MSTVQVECSHDLCVCMVTAPMGVSDPAEAYCSDQCQQSETVEEGDDVCACGHPGCDTP